MSEQMDEKVASPSLGSSVPRSKSIQLLPAPLDIEQKGLALLEGGKNRVAILDAGAQYGKVIDRRVRDLSVLSHILPLATPADELKDYQAIIISGGPQSVYGDAAPKYDPKIFQLGKPILGICYGMQLLNYVHKGTVHKGKVREDGQFSIDITNKDSALFQGLPSSVEVLLTHGDSVDEVAPGFVASAKSESGIVVAMENPKQQMYGVQFHPEVDLTQYGKEMFQNFLFKIAKFTGDYTLDSRLDRAVKYIQANVGDSDVLVLVSGGVDSTVCACLLQKALPAEKIYAMHVDTGYMRHGESATVEKALKSAGIHLKVVDASEAFAKATTTIDGVETETLDKAVQPEIKRKIIGDTFMRVSEQHIRSFHLNPKAVFLAQGTLRPDLIESASHKVSSNAAVIKTHHNDTQLVRLLRDQGRIIEPLMDYHKDEVRSIGAMLGLPEELIWRQPFPGPGLAIRILCANEPYITEHDDATVAALKAFEKEGVVATLLPCQTVGVQGDGRSYSSLVALSCDGEPNWPLLHNLAKQIPKVIHKVNRVVYMFGKPLASGKQTTITPTRLSPDAIKQLQHADKIVNQIILENKLYKSLSQVPVILFPADLGEKGKRCIAIRPFITNDFMTGLAAMPGRDIPVKAVNQMVDAIMKEVEGIARVCIDLTSKPPGTTEWE